MNTITVYDNIGKVVEVLDAKGLSSKTINTSSYNIGIYYLYIQTEAGEITKQFTVVD